MNDELIERYNAADETKKKITRYMNAYNNEKISLMELSGALQAVLKPTVMEIVNRRFYGAEGIFSAYENLKFLYRNRVIDYDEYIVGIFMLTNFATEDKEREATL